MINIVVALACEASPIVQHFRLKKLKQDHPFPIYDNGKIALIISGLGKVAAATAVGYLHALFAISRPSVWLNIGIAGHRFHPLGTGLIAHKILDHASGQSYFPCFTFEAPCLTTDVISVDQVEADYKYEAAYDMEASGFYAAAARFSTGELIHCLKVISDNQAFPAEQISKHLGQELVANHLLLIEDLCAELDQLNKSVALIYELPEEYEELNLRFHFTKSQQNQFKVLIRRWYAVNKVEISSSFELAKFSRAKQLISAIEDELESWQGTI